MSVPIGLILTDLALPFYIRLIVQLLLFIYLKLSWNSSTLATSCEELTHWKGLWCWEGLGAGRKGDDRGWDGWMAPPTRWRWVWVNSGSWWWTGRAGVLWFMGSQRVGQDWATEMNWTDYVYFHVLEPPLFENIIHEDQYKISYWNKLYLWGVWKCLNLKNTKNGWKIICPKWNIH